MTLQLRGAFSSNPRVAPLLDGTIQPTGIEIVWDQGEPGTQFEGHLRESAYDVFEFSISNFMITRERRNDLWDWTAIPVFPVKGLLALNTYVNVGSRVETAADLRGKRFGLPDYTMTAGLGFRMMLRELYDIQPMEITWFNGRPAEHSHGHQMGIDVQGPPRVTIVWLQDGELARKLDAGEIDAAYPTVDMPLPTNSPNLRRLFPDGGKQFLESAFRQAGFVPINHTVVVQRKLVEQEPWVPEALFEAFEHAKEEAYRRAPRSRAVIRGPEPDLEWEESVFGPDPYPYGLAAQRALLESTGKQSNLDGLTRQKVDVEGLFWETVRGT